MEINRGEILKVCVGLTFLVGVLIFYLGIWSLNAEMGATGSLTSGLPVLAWAACGLFLLGALLSYEACRRSLPRARLTLILSASAGVAILLPTLAQPYAILAFLLPILFAAFLHGWRGAAAWTGIDLLAGAAINAAIFRGSPIFPVVILPALVVAAIAAFVTIVFNQLFSDLEWYERNYVSAQQKEMIIRDNEAKLEQLVKDLVAYQGYLNITNELLVKAQDEAEKAKNAKQVFAQNVSHELRTPLNLIIGFSETLYNTPNSYAGVNWTPELRNDVACIYRSTQHLKSLIDDVLDLASLENHSYEINPVEVDLNAIILEATAISHQRYADKGLYLKTDLQDRPLLVRADPVRIRQVILNLLSNALKYTAAGGVTITSRRSYHGAHVDVSDTGKGIPPHAIEKVFEAFYQVDKSRNGDDSGTGLGLTISKQLIELHGGEIHINSVPGKGTTVKFSLPFAQ